MDKKQTYNEARMNTPAKQVVRRIERWLDDGKNREVRIGWKWNKINRFDRMGVIIASENGIDLVTKYYQNGDMRFPNPDFRRTNSHGHRHYALESMARDLEELEKFNAEQEAKETESKNSNE